MSSIEILLIVILCCVAFCYGLVKIVMAALRGFGTLLGLGDGARRVDEMLGRDNDGRVDRRLPGGPRQVPVRTASVRERHVCPAAGCRHANVTEARFCARCGHRLSA